MNIKRMSALTLVSLLSMVALQGSEAGRNLVALTDGIKDAVFSQSDTIVSTTSYSLTELYTKAIPSFVIGTCKIASSATSGFFSSLTKNLLSNTTSDNNNSNIFAKGIQKTGELVCEHPVKSTIGALSIIGVFEYQRRLKKAKKETEELKEEHKKLTRENTESQEKIITTIDNRRNIIKSQADNLIKNHITIEESINNLTNTIERNTEAIEKRNENLSKLSQENISDLITVNVENTIKINQDRDSKLEDYTKILRENNLVSQDVDTKNFDAAVTNFKNMLENFKVKK